MTDQTEIDKLTAGDFGYLSDEIRDYSSHVSGLSDGTHYIHDNRLAIWTDAAKNLEKRIAELEMELKHWRNHERHMVYTRQHEPSL